MKPERIYIRPDPDLTKEESAAQVAAALMNFFADQLEKEGKLDEAQCLRDEAARPSRVVRPRAYYARGKGVRGNPAGNDPDSLLSSSREKGE